MFSLGAPVACMAGTRSEGRGGIHEHRAGGNPHLSIAGIVPRKCVPDVPLACQVGHVEVSFLYFYICSFYFISFYFFSSVIHKECK